MITLAQISAEATTALTPNEVQVLTLLVKQSPDYSMAVGRWPLLADKFAEEQSTPTVKTPALRAVIKILGRVPSFVVESQGQTDAPSFFSTVSNWRQLALEVLNILYELPIILGNQHFVLVQRRIADITLIDNSILDRRSIGKLDGVI